MSPSGSVLGDVTVQVKSSVVTGESGVTSTTGAGGGLFDMVIVSSFGGLIGIVSAYFLRFIEISTTNWDTFSELAFSFETSGEIIIAAVIFSLVMGFVGGFLPAVRAARLKIVDSFRAP